ncbi:MAG: putative small multi-drug export protein [Candidatus Saganbacteria bacterium]|uniref:Putative small multi-drug export protein n=1 Tax=Candidatus Saganbacteria bacterium TaxID=2575572 RepID=A0A833NWS8_UNCSA|nr:MAG: putative small multi-drug export protein [Candidatus Saganbacteria bacterium]
MWIVELLKGLQGELVVLIASAIPVIEVRGSIPLGIMYYKLNAFNVVMLSIIGSVLPVFPLLWVLNNLTEKLRKVKVFDKFITWLFERTRSKSKLIKDLELVGLTLFIGVPLPGTGVWTGAIAAYLFGLPLIPSFFCCLFGTAIASVIVWMISAGVMRFF